LNSELTEEVYIKQPKGFQMKGQENKICKLQKVFYGLQQAFCAWYTKINIYFHNQGLTQGEAKCQCLLFQ
jgi:hypothetical protein